jgi:hypothetical protein
MVRGHGPSIPVRRREIPYWQERGWQRDGYHYTGSYQTPHAAFEGFIDDTWRGDIKCYLRDPSPEIRRSSHWACFASRGDDWFFVHMARRPADVSSAIMTIEKLICEAYQ